MKWWISFIVLLALLAVAIFSLGKIADYIQYLDLFLTKSESC